MAAQEFDVVLMDVQMPEMDGLQATAAIREGEKETGGHLPIVAMTAHALKGDRERCLAAGMDGYISKPINKEALFRAIDEAIGEVSRRESEQLVETTSTANPAVVNWPQILELVGGDPEALAGILRAYLVEMCEDLQLLREAVAARDAARLSRPAHKLLGAMRFFGAETAAEHARELESMNEHANWNHAVNLAVSLEQEIGRLLPEIEAYLRQ